MILLMCATNSKENAKLIASSIMDKKLAASIQIIDIESYYFWKSKIENQDEFLMIIKTKLNLYNEIETLIKTLHPYELPGIHYVQIDGGSELYLQWISDSVKNKS